MRAVDTAPPRGRRRLRPKPRSGKELRMPRARFGSTARPLRRSGAVEENRTIPGGVRATWRLSPQGVTDETDGPAAFRTASPVRSLPDLSVTSEGLPWEVLMGTPATEGTDSLSAG